VLLGIISINNIELVSERLSQFLLYKFALFRYKTSFSSTIHSLIVTLNQGWQNYTTGLLHDRPGQVQPTRMAAADRFLIEASICEYARTTIRDSYVFDRTRTSDEKITISNRLYFVWRVLKCNWKDLWVILLIVIK